MNTRTSYVAKPGRVQDHATGVGRLVKPTLRICAVVLLLSACDTPIGHAPPGTFLGNPIVTNPGGGGPQVILYGPPTGGGGGAG